MDQADSGNTEQCPPRPLVLVVDTDEASRGRCQQLVEQDGFECVSTGSPSEAIEFLRQRTVDILLCDVEAPELDGASVLEHATRMTHPPALAWMMLQTDPRTESRMLQSGGIPVVLKPLNPSDLGISLAWLVHERHAGVNGLPPSSLALLYRVVTAANAEAATPQVLERLLILILAALHGDSGTIITLAPGTPPRASTIVASHGLSLEPPREGTVSSSEVIDWVAANARPLRIVGALNTYPQFKHLEPNPKRADALIAPLLFGREVLGTICINSSRLNRFGPEALALLVSIAEVIAAALHRERIGRIREHHERLAVMGQLAATVAHELSNPLTVLMAAVDAMGELVDRMPMGAPGTAETQRTVVDARDAVNRMATLISEIKGAVRKPEAERQRLDLTAAAQRAATLVEADLRHRARLTIEHTGPQWVSADPSRIGQVLVNLIINASHALTGYGHITLRTRRGGAWSVIEVEDNGCGMPADVAARVFEPFFTTKPLGTGLGLSICKQIALDYGGKLTFETRIGSGTRFMLQLPAVEAVEEEKPVLLLVDDDELLLRAVGRVLSTKFRVLEASGPQEALALAASAPVQLVLTDFSMPIHNGLWLIRALRDRGIAAPAALLTAARASQEIEAALHSGLIVRVFTKPTNLMALAVEARALVRC